MGKSSGENVTFRVAGEQILNDILANANTTSLTLDRDWKRYEIDFAGADLYEIYHPFGSKGNSGEASYLEWEVCY